MIPIAVYGLYVGLVLFFFQAEDGIRDKLVTGVQTCALPISVSSMNPPRPNIPAPRTVPNEEPSNLLPPTPRLGNLPSRLGNLPATGAPSLLDRKSVV